MINRWIIISGDIFMKFFSEQIGKSLQVQFIFPALLYFFPYLLEVGLWSLEGSLAVSEFGGDFALGGVEIRDLARVVVHLDGHLGDGRLQLLVHVLRRRLALVWDVQLRQQVVQVHAQSVLLFLQSGIGEMSWNFNLVTKSFVDALSFSCHALEVEVKHSEIHIKKLKWQESLDQHSTTIPKIAMGEPPATLTS